MLEDDENGAGCINGMIMLLIMVSDITVSKNADQVLMPQFGYCFQLLWQALGRMLVLQFQTFHLDL